MLLHVQTYNSTKWTLLYLSAVNRGEGIRKLKRSVVMRTNPRRAIQSLLRTAQGIALALSLLVPGAIQPCPAASQNFMIGTDMGHTDLYFFNMDTDQRIKVDLSKDPMWPGGGRCPTSLMTTMPMSRTATSSPGRLDKRAT